MGNRRDYLVQRIVEICHKMDQKGWVANHDGNVSTKFEDRLLATPTAVSKADIVPQIIITLDMEGKKIDGIGNPFSEIKLHLCAYKIRPEITAVVHAHPPYAMARGLAGGDFQIQIPEAIVSIGDTIPVAPYAFPGAPENDAILGDALCRSDVVIMAGNGVLSVGRDLGEAYLRMELLEHLLKIDHYTRSMGPIMTIPESDRQKLLDKRAALGLGPQHIAPIPSTSSSLSPSSPASSANLSTASTQDLVKSLIADELKKLLKNQ